MPLLLPQSVLDAISFATWHHRHQVRKDGRTPYIAHPMRVMTILGLEFGMTDPEVLAAAVLHDTIEDTNADCDDIIEHFGERVASMVATMTKDKRLADEPREDEYLEGLVAAPIEVKLIKLADVIDNLIDSKFLPLEKREKPQRKAREILERFGVGFPAEWKHALERLERQLTAPV